MNYTMTKRFIIGLILGLSIMIPGLGPSTVMIYTNTYNDIITSVSNLKSSFKKNFNFLLPIVISALIGFVFGLLIIKFLFELAPLYWIYVFAGIMIALFPSVVKEKETKLDFKSIMFILLGVVIPLILLLITNNLFTFSNITYSFIDYTKLFVVGFLIALTQLIPGLSATILLMTLGIFYFLLDGIGFSLITNPKLLLVYVVMLIGVIVGVLAITKFISWLLSKFSYNMHCVTIGLSISSIFLLLLNKEVINYYPLLRWWEIIIIVILMITTIILILGIKKYKCIKK